MRQEVIALAGLCLLLAVLGSARLAYDPHPSLLLRSMTALCGGLSVLLVRWMKKPVNVLTSQGSATLTPPADDLLKDGGQGKDGAILLGRYGGEAVTLPRPLALRHGIVVGPSGAGKSFSFFLPNAVKAVGTSCVFTDPKSELWRYTSGLHRSESYAPGEPERSLGFNWIPLCRDARYAEIIARALVESGNVRYTEQAWLDMESAFLAALFAHTSTLSIPTPLTAYRLFTRQKQDTLLRQFERSRSSVAQEQSVIFRQASERMRGAIVPVVAAKLQFLRDPQVARFTSATLLPPDFSRLRDTPIAVYWRLREQDMSRLRPLSAVFFTVLIEQLARGEGSVDSYPGGVAGNVPVTLFLDEFGSIGTIPDFDTTLAVARGRNLSFWLGVQGLSQLTARYGKEAGQTILGNCHTKLALSGLDGETAEYFSKTAGQGTIEIWRRSANRKPLSWWPSSLSRTASEQGRAVLTPDEVRRLGEEEILAIVGNRQPMLLHRERFTQTPCTALVRPLGPSRAAPVAMERVTDFTNDEEEPMPDPPDEW
jgi:type IV secretion system protein VirD4